MSFLGKIFSGGIKETIDGISDIADKYITTPDEKKAFVKDMEELAQKKQATLINAAQAELDTQMKEIANSREMNLGVQVAEKASWLAKNIGYIIDLLVASIWASITIYLILSILNLIKSDTPPDLAVILGIYAGVTATFSTVLQFHRGSSIGSKQKDNIIKTLQDANNQSNPPVSK